MHDYKEEVLGSKQKTYKNLFLVVTLLIFLRPHFDFTSPFLATYFGDLIIIGILLYSVLLLKLQIYASHKRFLSISVLFLAALLIPTAVNSFKPASGFEIWFDYGKIVYFVALFWYLYFLLIRIQDRVTLLNKFMDWFFFIIFVVSMIQLFAPPVIGDLIHNLYGTTKLRSIWTGYPRVYGTFYNANWFGVYLVFYLAWLNSILLEKKVHFIAYLLRLILLVILFVVAGSRTAIIGAIICLSLQFLRVKSLHYIIALFLVGMGAYFCLQFLDLRIELIMNTVRRFVSVWNVFMEHGFVMAELNPGRWDAWVNTFHRFTAYPLFGCGSLEGSIPHNSYLYFLNMFGLVGVAIVFMSFLLCIIPFGSNKVCKPRPSVISVWKKGFVPAFLIMSLAADFLFTTQVMLLTVLLFVASLLSNEQKSTGAIRTSGDV